MTPASGEADSSSGPDGQASSRLASSSARLTVAKVLFGAQNERT
jgi:hypothetical protein